MNNATNRQLSIHEAELPELSEISEAKLEANRRNAQKSTGPTTPEGKKRSSLNALRTGLTAQVPVMTEEDRVAYDRFCAEIVESLDAETPLERQTAHLIADGHWRLHRAHNVENNLYSLGHVEDAGDFDASHPEVHNAYTHARAFRDHAHTFNTLSACEQRIDRALGRAIERLEHLQAARKAERNEAIQEALYLRQYNDLNNITETQPAKPSKRGFVFSAQALDLELDRRYRLLHGNWEYSNRMHAQERPLSAAA